MNEDYVSFETTKLLREKGLRYDMPTMLIASNNKPFISGSSGYDILTKIGIEVYPALTLQMAMKWLREVHNIHIAINILNDSQGVKDADNPERWWYYFDIVNTKGVYKEELQPNPLSNEYETYELAGEAAIKYVLENLI